VDTLVPEADVYLGGESLKHWGLNGFLKSISVTRVISRTRPTQSNAKGKAKRSSASLVFSNLDNQILTTLALKEGVDIWLGYGIGEMYYRGGFVVVKPNITFADTMDITLTLEDRSAEMVSSFPFRRFREGEKVGDIVANICREYGLDADIEEAIAETKILGPGMSKTNRESDWQFLERLLYTTGTGLMYVEPVAHGQDILVVKPITGKPVAFGVRNFQNISLGYKAYDADIHLKSVAITMDALDIKELKAGQVEDTGAALQTSTGGIVQHGQVVDNRSSINDASPQEPESTGSVSFDMPPGPLMLSAFEGAVALWNKFKIRLTAELHPAVPFLYPGQLVELKGVGPFSGKVLITEIKDSFGSSGYSQSLTMRSATQGGDLSGKKQFKVVRYQTTAGGITTVKVTDEPSFTAASEYYGK
jgi:hypothetical protein